MATARPLQPCKRKNLIQKMQVLLDAFDQRCCSCCDEAFGGGDLNEEEILQRSCAKLLHKRTSSEQTIGDGISQRRSSKNLLRRPDPPNPCTKVIPPTHHFSSARPQQRPYVEKVTVDGRVVCERGRPELEEPIPSRPPPNFRPRYASTELRGGLHFNGCLCIKRNGLQDDCPRWDCAGRPECDHDPWPTCLPQQTAEYLGQRKPNCAVVPNVPIADSFGYVKVPPDFKGRVLCSCSETLDISCPCRDNH